MPSLKELMAECDIESADDFIYFEQFSAVMEYPEEIDYDTFLEVFSIPEREELKNMTEAFFEDLIRGIPDDDMELYTAIQSYKDSLLALADMDHGRSFGFYVDVLYNFRTWLTQPDSVSVRPEAGGEEMSVSPLEALMLYREEKLSGPKYEYDFSGSMPDMDDTLLEAVDELKQESGYTDSDYPDYEYEDDMTSIDDVLRELPDEVDLDNFDEEAWNDRPIDPYTEGFVDRDDPVIVGPGSFDDDTYTEDL